jgi:benzoyl-CoA reductase/2-hydroxyglutaryl-CoA dehydratase subunit BcrC/BadD/HgdB
MAIPNWKLHHIVETSGAAVVVEESCTGTRYFENEVDESGTTIDEQIGAIAARYLKTNCACFTPNPGRVEDILRLVREYRVDGVIDYTLQFCGLYSTESYLVQQALKEAGVPVLHIETDYSEQDGEQIRTRVEAFLEIIGK